MLACLLVLDVVDPVGTLRGVGPVDTRIARLLVDVQSRSQYVHHFCDRSQTLSLSGHISVKILCSTGELIAIRTGAGRPFVPNPKSFQVDHQ